MFSSLIRSFYTLLICIFLSACVDPANNGIPSYIQINEVELITQPGQGSNIHGITALWVESEGVNLGVYEYPVVLPALFSGNRELLINAGIDQSGDFFIREIYPCYQVFDTTLIFTETDTVIIEPKFIYKPQANFLLIEDFESSNIFSGMDRTLVGDPENLEGRSAIAELSTSNPSVQALTGSAVAIPQGPRVYVEFHYKGTNDFGLGIESIIGGNVDQSSFFAVMNPSDDWRKIYIDLTDIINGLNGDEYKFYINASLLGELDDATVYFDNFKVITL